MSKSHKKKPHTAGTGGKAPAGAALAGSADPSQPATAALTAGRFKEAVELFKDLLKRERRQPWLEGLAAAYAGRADQLASKGMVKEALALWRIRAEACDLTLLDGRYVGWLLQAGQIEAALGLLPTLDKLPAEAREPARLQMAAAMLMAPEHLLSGWSKESLDQRAAARAAVAACANADAAGLETALQAISFRSPYRDLRPLLKSLALQGSDAAAASASLARVSDQGPFEPLARALRVSLLPGQQWLASLASLDEAGRALVLDLKGCPPTQRALVLDLAAAQAAPSTPLALLDLLLRHKRALPETLARQQGLRLLPHAPQRLDAFRAAFLPPSAAEEAQLLALSAEVREQSGRAESHWLKLVKLMGATPAGKGRAALVLRRLAGEHISHSPQGMLCVHAHDWLEQSLQFDPLDRESHLRLLRDARLRGESKQARNYLDAARQHFPADTQVLMEAVEIALSAGAFKKAASLGREMLTADPLNPHVRALIGQAHLAHARKLISTRKLPAALSELDAATEWLRSPAERGPMMLRRGLISEPAAAGDALLRQTVAELGGWLAGGFQLLLQSKRSLPPSQFTPLPLLRRAGVDVSLTPSAADLTALARALDAAPEHDTAAAAAMGVFSAALQRAAANVRFNESDTLLVCEALHRQGLPKLTESFAAAALQHWPQRPAFIYLEASARYADDPGRMSEREWDRLDQVFEEAEKQGDQRTASRLSKLLSAVERAGGGGFDDDHLPNGTEDLDDAQIQQLMDEMLESGGIDRFLDIARQQLGKASFEDLKRAFPGSRKQLARHLVEILATEMQNEKDSLALPPKASAPKLPRPGKFPKPAAADKRQLDFFDD